MMKVLPLEHGGEHDVESMQYEILAEGSVREQVRRGNIVARPLHKHFYIKQKSAFNGTMPLYILISVVCMSLRIVVIIIRKNKLNK